jgi:hypothetical protein
MMLVDCHTCPVRDVHCADCMVTALTTIPIRSHADGPTAEGRRTAHDRGRRIAVGHGDHPDRHGDYHDHHDADEVVTAPLDRAERRAVSAFLAAGLVSTATANAVRAELDPVDFRPVDLVPVDGRPGELGSLRRTRRAV